MTMVQHALTLSPAATVGVDALRWIARRHRIITILPGMAVGTAGPWMHVLTLPELPEAIGLQPGTAATLSADDVLQAGRRTLQKLIERRASIRPDTTAWVSGIRNLVRSRYSHIATVRSDIVSRADVTDWMSTMRMTTDQPRRLIMMQSERGRHIVRIQADHVSREFTCAVEARHLLTAIMDCQADAVTLSISKWSILRIAPAGHDAAARSVYLLTT